MTNRSFRPSSSSSSLLPQSPRRLNARPTFARKDSGSDTSPANESQDKEYFSRQRQGSAAPERHTSTHDLQISASGTKLGLRLDLKGLLPASPASRPQSDSKPTEPVTRSKPIAIELPPRRRSKPNGFATPTPPEPLSARGDLPGGYFPLHEAVIRSHRPHPFYSEHLSRPSNLSRSRRSSDAEEPEDTDDENPTPNVPLFREPNYSSNFNSKTENSSRDSSVSRRKMSNKNLNPSAPAGPVPQMPSTASLGKYHPSNYKNASASDSPVSSSTGSSSATPSALRPTNQNADNKVYHQRQSSAVSRQLKQYQLEMAEKTAFAGNITFDRPKPVSPRLEPLGSPGPVTPMALEESSGYLTAGLKTANTNPKSPLGSPGGKINRTISIADATDMIKRMIDKEDERDAERNRQQSIGEKTGVQDES